MFVLIILSIICFIVSFVSFFYILIKKAVKNGVLEALNEYKSHYHCEN